MRLALGKFGDTRGARMLRAYFELPDSPSQRAIAARLGVDEGLVYWWKSGHRRPGRIYRLALKRIAGIPLRAWLTAAERAREKRVRAA